MVDLVALLPDEDLRRRYGTPTLDRAWGYVRSGKVLRCTHELDSDGDLDIRGSVAGSTGPPYVVDVSVGEDTHGTWVFGRCSCPVREGCKHMVALLITVRDEQARTGPDRGRRWERQLTTVLDELDERAERTAGPTTPLGLRLDLKPPPRSAGLRSIQAGPGRSTLRLRPVRQGARQTWVKSGIEWTFVRHLDREGRTHPAAQVTALNDLLSGHTSASRQIVFGVDGSIPLGGFGPDEMRLLRRCVDAGIELVAGAGLSAGTLADPGTMRLDVHAPDDGDGLLRLGVTHEQEWYSPGNLDVVSEGLAVALWDADGDRWSVTLAALTHPLGPQVRRLLAVGDGLRVPVAHRDELVTDYLPLLQRHVPLVSADGTVAVPETAEPRLVLAVDWVAVDEVRIGWTFRYRMGHDDRVYDLSETRGLRGLRRPDREGEPLDAPRPDREPAHHLCPAPPP